MTDTKTRGTISLKGSATLVQEFFNYGINSILYQRGIYPADSFKREKKYNLPLYVTADPKLLEFLEPLFKQVEDFLAKKLLKKLVVVIQEVRTKDVLERWQFDIETEDVADEGENSTRQKDVKTIQKEMSDVIRQITASVSFLPLLEQACSFDVLIYTKKGGRGAEGLDRQRRLSHQGRRTCNGSSFSYGDLEAVQLRSFSTAIHNVQTAVQYKPDL
ncbi:unnamed protein product, partial [Mesorhabditis spiculigera]